MRELTVTFNQDKEQLYQQALSLKQQMNLVISESTQVKTQIKVMERELQNRDRMLEEAFTTG